MNLDSYYALGIDVGGTKIAAGVVRFPNMKVCSRRIIPTGAGRGGAAVLEDVVRLATELVEESATAGTPVRAIGLGLCELVDSGGRILSAHSVRWQDQPVHARLSRLAPFVLEADVRAAALAEARFGAGKSQSILLYVTVGTGISCCLVIDGRPFTGARGLTGTFASSPLVAICERCGYSEWRSLEAVSAGPALVARYNQQPFPGRAESGHDVLAAAAAGDPAALQVVRTAGEALGLAVGQLVNVLDPSAVVVGGGLGLSEGAYWESFTLAARRQIWSQLHRDLPILHAAAGADAGVIGAAAAAWGG